jgi:hypothetical protein
MESKYRSNRPDIPVDWYLLTNSSDPDWRAKYLVAGELPHAVFLQLVDKARENDTALCYNMSDTWARGKLANTRATWACTPSHRKWLATVAATSGISAEDLFKFDLTIHWKRAKGQCLNEKQTIPGDLVIFYIDSIERVGIWYRITRLDGSPLHITDETDPRWPHTCFVCCNRFKRKLGSCSTCHKRFYCGPTCQRFDWAIHKLEHNQLS